MSELIAAIATPPGPGGVGILRLSGPGAAQAAAHIFQPLGKTPLSEAPDRQLLYGRVFDQAGELLDTGLAFVSRAPHSYTGEETAEIQCHGSPVVLSLALDALCAAGARLARPGEFTQRAFLNGKLDLTQAEAVIDLIDAETPAAARQAAGQLNGALSRQIDGIYSALTDLMAHFCAVLDYPDEDIDPFQAEQMGQILARQEAALQALLATSRRGTLLHQGITCVLIGRPNAGKSSLLNALAGYERAIVTNIPGTTRDTVETKVTLGGYLFRLVDTAGLRDSDDPIEQLGVARSRQALAEADLVLAVCDGTQPLRSPRPAPSGPGPGGHHPAGQQAGPARLRSAPARRQRCPEHPDRRPPQRQDGGRPGHLRDHPGPAGRDPPPPGGPVRRRGTAHQPAPDPGGPAGLGRRDPRQRRPRPGHDPRCPSHRRGSRPGSPGRADRPHRPGGYHRPHLLPLLRGEMRGNTKVVQFSVIFSEKVLDFYTTFLLY